MICIKSLNVLNKKLRKFKFQIYLNKKTPNYINLGVFLFKISENFRLKIFLKNYLYSLPQTRYFCKYLKIFAALLLVF